MTDTFGYGEQDPDDTSSDHNVLAFIVNQMLARVRTMTIVQVKSVGADGLTVSVQPLVNMVDGIGNKTEHGTIFNIPVFRLQSGNGAIKCDPVVGDIGFMAVADRDISAVKNTAAPANPGSYRRFNLADGVYMGGVLNAAPSQYVVFDSTGVTLSDKNGNVIFMGPDGIHMRGNVHLDAGANLLVSGAVTAGVGTADQVGLQSHLHTSGGSGSPTSVPTPGT